MLKPGPVDTTTGVRDYVHVVDLAQAHVAATDRIAGNHGVEVFNIGTGQGYSVLDMIKALGKACGKELPYKVRGGAQNRRRVGVATDKGPRQRLPMTPRSLTVVLATRPWCLPTARSPRRRYLARPGKGARGRVDGV